MLTPRHPFYPRFRELLCAAAAHQPVYDLGTSQRFAKELSFARDLFDEKTYFAGGYSAESGVAPGGCDFDCDVHDLRGMADACAGAVLSMNVLEHVENPLRAAREMHRVLRPGGQAVIAVPFLISYHGKRPLPKNPVFVRSATVRGNSAHNGYGDFWRFTHEGLAQLLGEAGFDRVDVWPIDGPLIARLELLGLFTKLSRVPLLSRLLVKLDSPRLGKATSGHVAVAFKESN
jgi:SAM-dependent methyltransferase